MKIQRMGRSGKALTHHARRHSIRILKTRSHPVPWAWMIICGMATLAPLCFGYTRNETAVAIYGALSGYFIGLCDHPGTIVNRSLVATIALAALWLGVVAGIELQQSFVAFLGITLAAVYGYGLLGGRGAEFERLILFALVDLIIARYSRILTTAMIPSFTGYIGVAYATVMLGILVSTLTLQKQPGKFSTVKESVRHAFTLSLGRHFHALSYVFAVGIAIMAIETFQIQRGYWTIITVLLVMKPDRKESIDRVFQRLFGTLLGVFTGEIIVLSHVPVPWMLAGAAFCAMLVPYGWNRNYWIVAFFVTNLVILLLSIAQSGQPDATVAFLRLKATLYACGICIVAIMTFRIIEHYFPILRREHH